MRQKVILITVVSLVALGFVDSLNETKIVFGDGDNVFLSRSNNNNVTESRNAQVNSRNSRQLWSLFKNVVKSSLDNKGSSGSSSSSSTGSSNSNSNANPVSGGLGALASLFGSAVASASGISSGDHNNKGQLAHASVTRPQYSSHYNPYQHLVLPPSPAPPPPPNRYSNPNEYMHWLLLNSQQNQHESLPHYQIQQQKKEKEGIQEMIDKYKEQLQTSGSEKVEVGSTGDANAGTQILNKLAFGSFLDNLDLDNLGSILSFGRFEGMIEKVNKFDRLKCIPRLLCQMVAKRQEDTKSESTTEASESSKTNRRHHNDDDTDDDDHEKKLKTDKKEADRKDQKKDEEDASGSDKERKDDTKEKEKPADVEKPPNKNKQKNKVKPKPKESSKDEDEEEEDDEDVGNNDDDDDDDEDDDSSEEEHKRIEYEIIKPGTEKEGQKEGRNGKGVREGRIFKINGADSALEQFVKFLELMQLKDWSLYPYLHGAYQGHQVSRSEDCAYRFSTCPFSDDQLVYYFNNYNNGIFHSIF